MLLLKKLKNLYESNTFHLWGCLLILICFAYFLGPYMYYGINGLIEYEEKVFTSIAFCFWSFCIIIGTSIFLGLQNFDFFYRNQFARMFKSYKYKRKSILYMTALTVILTIFLLILTSLFPKYTASETSQIKSGLKIEFSQYPNVISERISGNNYDSDGNIFKITHIVECAGILNEHFTIQSYKNTNNVKMFSIEKFNSILQSHKQFGEFGLIEKDKILQDICNL